LSRNLHTDLYAVTRLADGHRNPKSKTDMRETPKPLTIKNPDNHYDLLVVGAGITGVGCALDAALRGLKVLCVDSGDIAGGTSSKSSKLVHGGLRYLEHFDLGLVAESLREQSYLLHSIAPYQAIAAYFLMPTRHWWQAAYVRLGTALYDMLGRRPAQLRAKMLRRDGLDQHFPGLRAELRHGVCYMDGLMDDARLAFTVARSAADAGAHFCTYRGVTAAAKTAQGWRVTLADTSTVDADRVIIATGAYSTAVANLFGGADLAIQPARGSHITIARERLAGAQPLITKTATSVLFIIPQGDVWILGTTDVPHDGSLEGVEATKAEIDYIIAEANKVLGTPISRRDVIASFAGVRPLVRQAGTGGATSKISRQHVVAETGEGAVLVTGGKYTTYRQMAEDAVDAALVRAPFQQATNCRTRRYPLWGAENWRGASKAEASLQANWPQLGEISCSRLVARYGNRAGSVLSYTDHLPNFDQPISAIQPSLWAELYYGVIGEGASSMDDILLRRVRGDLWPFSAADQRLIYDQLLATGLLPASSLTTTPQNDKMRANNIGVE